MQVFLVIFGFTVFYTGTTNMLGSSRIGTGFTILLIFQVHISLLLCLPAALDNRRVGNGTHSTAHARPCELPDSADPAVVSQVANVVVSTWLPICGETLWVNSFNTLNSAFAHLALVESMVVVLLQDKSSKTFFPEEWQIDRHFGKLKECGAIKACLARLPRSIRPTSTRPGGSGSLSPDGAYDNRFGTPSLAPFAWTPPQGFLARHTRGALRMVADVVSYAAVEFRERAAVKKRNSTMESSSPTSASARARRGRWATLNTVSKAQWMDAQLDCEDDSETLANRLVFYEKLFFQVDAADGDVQGCAS